MARAGNTQSQGVAGADPAPPSLSQIAAEMFGQDFHGDPDKPKQPQGVLDDAGPTQADDDDQGAAAQAGDDEAGQGDEAAQQQTGDDDDAGAGDEATSQGDDTEGADDETDAGEQIRSLSELREHLEADPDWFDSLQVDVVVNGKSSQVPLKDVVGAYRTNLAAEDRLEQAKLKSTEAMKEIEQRNTALEVQFATANKLIEQAETLLSQDVSNVDWKTLELEDPALFAAKKVAFNERASQLQALKQGVIQQFQGIITERQQKQRDEQEAAVAEGRKLLAENMPKINPEWGDAEKLPQVKSRLAEYAVNLGFTPDDLSQVVDWRMMAILEKARMYDEQKGKVDLTKKRIRTVPKVSKPGARKAPQNVNLDAVSKAQARLRSTGDLEDAAALLRAKRQRV